MSSSGPGVDDPSYAGSPSASDRSEGVDPTLEPRFRSVVENASEIFKIVDVDGTLRYANPAFERVLGYDLREAVGMNVLEYVHPEDLPHVLEKTEETMSGQGVGRNLAEYRFRHADGSWRHFESTGTYLLDDPDVRGVVVTARDVTERKELEEALRESERRYATLLANVPALVYRCSTKDPNWPMEFVSDYATELTGYAPGDLVVGGKVRYGALIVEEDHQRVWEEVQRALHERRRFRLRYAICRRDGALRHVEEYGQGIHGEDGRAEVIEGLIYDVTERKGAEESVRRSEAALAEAERMAHLGSWEWDVRTDEVWWSDETYRIYGFEPRQLLPTVEGFLRVVHPDDRKRVAGFLDGASSGYEPYDFEHRVVRPGGEVRVVHRRAEVVRDGVGDPLKMTGTVHDVTERKALEERLEYQAFHDSLTDLPNRHLFANRLEHALERTERQSTKVAVLLMDLDGFKIVNDSLGHDAGDKLLVAVAERLRGCVRPEDTLARFGGDEFTVLIEDVEGPGDAARVAERIADQLRTPFSVEGRKIFARFSAGIALGDARTKGPDELLREADTAMYRAKEEASDHRVFDPVMHERSVKLLEFENDLKRAVEAREFVVHYQPIIDLRTAGVWGMEALVRWEHPKRGLLNPCEFVPGAEENGLVVPIGELVLEQACRSMARLQREHPRTPPLIVSVNLSARQIRRDDIAEIVERTLRESGLEARCLKLDITETSYIRILEGNTAALNRLRALGVGISLDDFGTGYSSLGYLKRLPADALKIDRSFVAGLGEDVEDTAIVSMVIELAHAFGMEVIAEGVESGAQAEQLREMGCDMAQGYFFAKPLTPEIVPHFLSR